MCSSSPDTPKVPKPLPPPEYADYANRRRQSKRPAVGSSNQTILTSPLGLAGSATTRQPTLLGR